MGAMSPSPLAVVTGASSGIGAASPRRRATEGFHVVAVARRADRLDRLVKEITGGGGRATAVTGDVTRAADVAALAATVDELGGALTLLVNNAGGARGTEPIEAAKVDDWQWMYEVNVLGTLRVTQALLPALERSGAGTVVVLSSTAGLIVYEGGGGYAAAKHAQTAVAETLRLELCGRPVRVVEIDPGMVKTAEVSLNRVGGGPDAAAEGYAGVPNPLTAGTSPTA